MEGSPSVGAAADPILDVATEHPHHPTPSVGAAEALSVCTCLPFLLLCLETQASWLRINNDTLSVLVRLRLENFIAQSWKRGSSSQLWPNLQTPFTKPLTDEGSCSRIMRHARIEIDILLQHTLPELVWALALFSSSQSYNRYHLCLTLTGSPTTPQKLLYCMTTIGSQHLCFICASSVPLTFTDMGHQLVCGR